MRSAAFFHAMAWNGLCGVETTLADLPTAWSSYLNMSSETATTIPSWRYGHEWYVF